MIFELDTLTVTLDAPAQYPQQPDIELIQASEKSASGITHVEDFSVQTNTITYNFSDMSQNDYEKVLGWFVNTVNGKMTQFYLTDDLGVKRFVRFTSSRIKFDSNSFQLWKGSFQVEVVQ